MANPPISKLYRLILEFLGDKKEHKLVDIVNKIMEEFELLTIKKTPKKKASKFDTTIRWAVYHLHYAGLLDRSGRGQYKIAKKGLKIHKSSAVKINEAFLLKYSGFKEWRNTSAERKRINEQKATPLTDAKGIVAIMDVLGIKGSWKLTKAAQTQKKWNKLYELVFTHLTRNTAIGKFDLHVFSDTMIITIAGDEEKLAEFGKIIWEAIAHSIMNEIPIRGCFSYGTFSKNQNLIIGEAIDDAAEYYEQTQWIGISAAPRANRIISKKIENKNHPWNQWFSKLMLPLKESIEQDVWVINWPRQCDETASKDYDLDKIIKKIDQNLEKPIDLKAMLKWRNTRKFCSDVREEIQQGHPFT